MHRLSRLDSTSILRSTIRAKYLLASYSTSTDTFINANSASYVDQMYSSWQTDSKSVHLSWQIYFDSLHTSKHPSSLFTPPPTILPQAEGAAGFIAPQTLNIPSQNVLEHMKVQLMVRAYQVRGHQLADTDPLGINNRTHKDAPELHFSYYGFTLKDLDRKFFLGAGILPYFADQVKEMTLKEIYEKLKQIYCGSIGIEYGHIADRASCDWLRAKFETPERFKYSKQQKLVIFDRLMWSDSFERFVAAKFPSEKRFGLEGCESLIPGMKGMIDNLVVNGVNAVVIGMPHRGRLNVLSNVVRKPNESILSEFSGSVNNTVEGSGDVKYHLGMNYSRPTPSGKIVNISLAANPSHLEAVNPVVQGKVRAIQFYQNDSKDRSKAIGILLHGDAAFAGQGVVYEALGLSDLPAYTTGGSIHIVVNNQIGFTTDPRFSRSTPYCTDVAKAADAPIIHVNGDDVEAVVYACELASEWRTKFKKDVVIDLVCYRKHGHNEIDQPGFTQPLMYQRISQMKPVIEKYKEQLLSEGDVSAQDIVNIKAEVYRKLEASYEISKTYKSNSKEWESSAWPGFKSPAELSEKAWPSRATGVKTEVLKHIGLATSAYPATNFQVHNNLAKILKTRETSINDGEGIDWATAEAMAFGTLLAEGTHVRLSGQDVERGTFSQRHSVLHDQKTEQLHVPLNHLAKEGTLVPKQAEFTVCNSSLSEYGVLGFEVGYSTAEPNQLVLYESQFGDFCNNAQCIIDQFISSGEQKWLQRTGLTMLLPHGYDGQGPEHSSTRVERFLQLCDESPYMMPELESAKKHSYARQHQDCNMQVVYPTVPSNYFHILRRQVHREFRKPLVLLASKALLRHPMAKSSLAEMAPGTRFQRLIPELLHPSPLTMGQVPELFTETNNTEPRIPYSLQKSDFKLLNPDKIKTLVFCSGQVYYNLYKARELNKLKDTAIVRVEQICPFPFWEVQKVVDYYGKGLEEIVWSQEESMNSGSWLHVEPRFHTAIRESQWYKSGSGKKWQEKLEQSRFAGGLENGKSNTRKHVSIRGGVTIRYAGRDQSAAPATGFKKQHKYEESMLISEALMQGKLLEAKEMVNGTPLF